MPVSYVGGNAAENGGGSGSISVTKPTGLQNGDVLFAAVTVKNYLNTVTLPTGFVSEQVASTSSFDLYTVLAWKVVTDAASEPASYLFSFGSSAKGAASVTAYRGVNTDTPVIGKSGANTTTTSPTSFSIIQHPYRPHTMAFFLLSGTSNTGSTWSSTDTTAYPVDERIDITSSGGGPGTGKVGISIGDALVTPAEYTSGGTIYAGGNYYNVTHGSSNAFYITWVINAADASAVGAATTFDATATLSEIRTSPLQWTESINTARVSSVSGGSPHISNPDAAYEVLNDPGRMIGIYSEWHYDSSFAPERDQEGRAISFKAINSDYTKWGEKEADFLWQGRHYGATANDTERLSDNTFVVLTSYGHAGFYDGPGGTYGENSTWSSDPNIVEILKIEGNTITTVASTSVSGETAYLGTATRGGPNTVVFSYSLTNSSPAPYGGRVWYYTGSSWTMGLQYPYANDGRSVTYQVQASHVDDSKIVFFYSDSTLGGYVGRVGNLSNDANGYKTVITYGAEALLPNSTTSSLYVAHTKPVVLSATEGLLLLKQSDDGNALWLVKYIINPDDTITYDTANRIEITRDVGGSQNKQGLCSMLLKGDKLIVQYVAYQNTSPYYTVRIATFSYDSATGALTLDTDVALFDPSTTHRVANPTLSNGSGPYYHLNYFDYTVSTRLPQLQTLSVPISELETDSTNDLSAYVHVAEPNPLNHTQAAVCFINTEGEYAPGQKAFIAAPATPVSNPPDLDAFIVSAGAEDSTVLAHITYTPFTEGSQTAFIQAGAEYAPELKAFVSGPAITDNNPPQPSFIWGVGPHPDMPSMSCFIDGLRVLGRINPVGAIHLDRSAQQYIEFDDLDGIRPTGEFTLNFWMKAFNTSDGNYGVFLEKDWGTSQTIGIYEHGTSGVNGWHYGVNTNGTWNAVNSTATWTADTWNMITLKYTGSQVRFYVNGVFDTSFAKTGEVSWTTDPWRVGYRQNTGEYTTMTFAEFKMWNYALTDAEIDNLHNFKLEWGVGAYIEGGTFDVAEKSLTAHIVSDASTVNPLSISSYMAISWAFNGQYEMQPCHIVGGEKSKVKHDLEIVVDQFKKHKHDLILRTNGQGEDILSKFLGQVDYPVSREAREYMTGVFFKDMPGKESVSQACYMHSGFVAEDSLNAHIVGPRMLNAQTNCFINTVIQWSGEKVLCFIPNEWGYVSQAAHINSNDIVSQTPPPIYCHIAYEAETTGREITAFTSGWDWATPSHQRAYIPTQEIVQGFTQCHIHTPDVQKTTVPRQNMYVFSSALAYSPLFSLYMFGVNVAEQPPVKGFVHCQPTAEVIVKCFINVSLPAIPDRHQDAFIYGNQPSDVSVLAHIQADMNAVPTNDLKIHLTGWGFRESARYAYVVNTVSYGEKAQRAYVAAPMSTSDTQTCFIVNSDTNPFSNVDAVLSYSGAPIPKSNTKRCFIVGQPPVIERLDAFIFGTNVTTGNEGNDLFIYIEGGV